jgi:hypothetical protein
LIARFTVGHDLNNKYCNSGEQKDVDKAAFVEGKLQNEPNNQQTRPYDPHFPGLPTRAVGLING